MLARRLVSLVIALALQNAPLTSSSECGSSWGSYILASSGAHDCTGCGESIGSYEACELASESGASHLEIAEWADHSESWNGPPGCHVQDATNFQWNANEEGDSAAGYTPVCRLRETVAGQELYITTATEGWGSDSGGRVDVQLVNSAGCLKAQATLGNFRKQGALTTWNANGVEWAFGDQIRFKWTSGDGWRVSGLSLSGFVLEGQAPPFWLDRDGCDSCSVRVACGGASVQWSPDECYNQLQCNNQGSECATRMVWTLRDHVHPFTRPPDETPCLGEDTFAPSPTSSSRSGTGTGTDDGGRDVALIVVIGVVGVVLAAAIGVGVYCAKKGKPADKPAGAAPGAGSVAAANPQPRAAPMATAAVPTAPSNVATGVAVASQMSNVEKLKELKQLLDNGALTKEEFDAQKKATLDAMAKHVNVDANHV